jgi:chromosome segregation ATPase
LINVSQTDTERVVALMPQVCEATALAQHYKRLQERTQQQLRDESRRASQLASEHALLQKEHLAALEQQKQLERALHGTVADSGQRATDHERCSRLLRAELCGSEAQLGKALHSVQVMAASRRVLVAEVRELRQLLQVPVQEQLDFEGLREEATTLLIEKEQRVQELEDSVAELRSQLALREEATTLLGEKEQRVHTLLKEKEQRVQELEESVAELRSQLALREGATTLLREKEQRVKELEDSDAELRSQLASHRKALHLGKQISDEVRCDWGWCGCIWCGMGKVWCGVV